MKIKVMKFGGSSLADWQCFTQVASIVHQASQQQKIALVLSAPASVTNHLLAMIGEALTSNNEPRNNNELLSIEQVEQTFLAIYAELAKQLPAEQQYRLQQELNAQFYFWRSTLKGVELLGDCPNKITAQIIAGGEKLSIALMAALLSSLGKQCQRLDPQRLLVASNDYLAASVDIDSSKAHFAKLNLADAEVWLMAGFTAGNPQGELVTLGRNGSDYSAAVLAACLDADSCEIWTDVNGVYNIDPNIVADAKLLAQLTYQEAMEISYFGAKVLHPRTIVPIAQYHIPCYIKNTFNPELAGTLISDTKDDSDLKVKAISSLENQTMFDISGPKMKGMVGMASRILTAIAAADISISLITQSSSEYSICFCIASDQANKAKQALELQFELELTSGLLEPIKMRHQLAIVSLIGDGMRTHKGIAATLFQALAQANINIIAIAQGSSERSISAVIKQSKSQRACVACHQALFNVQQYIDVFLVGSGNVGRTLLNQIEQQATALAQQNISIRVCAITDSKAMLLDAKGIALNNWPALFADFSKPLDFERMFAWVKRQQLLNPVLVDCTASQWVADHYLQAMQAGLHVVTPNKKANTREYAYYQDLRATALLYRRQFLYEATVGAGLPVIDNLKKLLAAGDKLSQFSGILSGSLSYIFGKLEDGLTLSEATRIAKQNCFTEPDPREDLTGMDVARKLLILAREVGMPLELADIKVEPIVAQEMFEHSDVDSFMQQLTQCDEAMQQRVSSAQQQGKVLRYVGQITQQGCEVKIAEIGQDDALFTVKNGENALVFHSQYYQPLPLVLRGYGAGTAVTAAGTFSDILRTLNWTKEVCL